MKLKLKTLLIVIFPTLVWLVWTYPLVNNLSTHIYSDYLGDSVMWIRYHADIVLLQSEPLYSPILRLILKSIFAVSNSIMAFNISILFGFLGTFWGGFYLFRILKFKYIVSFFGAACLLLAPLRMWYSFEWPNHAQWGFLLIYLACLAKLVSQKRLRTVTSVVCGLLFALNLVENYYYGFVLFWITLIALFCGAMYGKWSKNWRTVVAPLVVFACFAFFGAFPALHTIAKTYEGGATLAQHVTRSPEDRFTFSARPWHYLIPDINHPVLGDVGLRVHRWIWEHPPYYLTERFFPKEHTLYLGCTLLLFSTYALLKAVKKQTSSSDQFHIFLFSLVAITMFIFSLPPFMSLGGIKFYFPSYFLYAVLPQIRVYARFGVLVFISNTILACFGLKYFLRKIIDKRLLSVSFVLAAVFALVVFEFMNFPPSHVTSLELPSAYQWLSVQKGEFSYLEYPSQSFFTDQFYQSTHQKEILNPYRRVSPEIKELLWGINKPTFVEDFHSLGGEYIFVHKPEEKSEKQRVAESWGFPAWGTHGRQPEGENLYTKDSQFFERDVRFEKVFESLTTTVFEVL